MQKLTKDQAIVVSGFTGFMACPFAALHEDVERRLGYPVFSHQFGDKAFADKVKDLYRADFLSICSEED